MSDTRSADTELVLSAVLEPPDLGRRSWIRWIERCPLDDAPSWAIPLLPAVAANLADFRHPVADSGRLAGLRRRQWYQNQLVRSRYLSASEALERSGISVSEQGGLPISGLWPEPAVRPLDDARLVIEPEDALRALQVLRDAGFATPSCDMPVWHDRLAVLHPDGSPVHLSCWILGPWVARTESELEWRRSSAMTLASPANLLVQILGRRLLHSPSEHLGGILWQLDAVRAIEGGALEGTLFDDAVAALRLGAVVEDRLAVLGVDRSATGRGGSFEYHAWQRGARRVQQLWHHARLGEPAHRSLWGGSPFRYRRHLASHGPV